MVEAASRSTEDTQRAAAQTRAATARGRAGAARRARDSAATEYARRAHSRVADLNAGMARHHEHSARTIRSGAGDSDRDTA
jgi:hypothetical protein